MLIPPDEAAEMAPIRPELGEFRAHYAGFFDPGFGIAPYEGRAVLEVRSRDVPFIVEDGQPVGKLVFEPLTAPVERLYGEAGSELSGAGPEALEAFRAVEVTAGACLVIRLSRNHPLTGGHSAKSPVDDAGRHRRKDRRRGACIRSVARCSGAAARRTGPALGRSAARTQAGIGAAGDAREREDSSEGAGEVQEMIDICDFAVGLSRQLHGLDHRLRASRASSHRALAPARRGRRHHRLQLSRRGLCMERRARAHLRRQRDLEAERKDAALRRSGDGEF